MKIAIIGSGIAGLTCAHYLHQKNKVTLFERNHYPGGHSATVDVEVASGSYAIDTGFIVFNDRTYPHFQQLLAELNIKTHKTQMSFSVRNDNSGLEYNGHTLLSLFAQKRNWLNPRFYYFLNEILRFNRNARAVYFAAKNGNAACEQQTLGEFLTANKFTDYFCQHYILPMGAAIWSSTLSDMRAFPLHFFLRFFDHHGLLEITNRPQWYVVSGGSREYVEKLLAGFNGHIKLNCPVINVQRKESGIFVRTAKGEERFDQVIFACHSDEALALLDAPTENEKAILSAMPYQKNKVVLHMDSQLLPKRKAAWASWNYHLSHVQSGVQGEKLDENAPARVTYNMNILQGLEAPETFCVTLNHSEAIAKDKILAEFVYTHPVFNQASLKAQQSRHMINGVHGIWYCGAYWYNGFHEDGVRSGLDVVKGITQLNLAPR